MTPTPINLLSKLRQFSDQWSPKIIAEMDGFHFKLAKLEGEFVWHSHAETDEAFFVIDGQLCIEFRDRVVSLTAGEMLVVPKGVEHKPVAELECHVMIFERAGTINTGNALENELTAGAGEWI